MMRLSGSFHKKSLILLLAVLGGLSFGARAEENKNPTQVAVSKGTLTDGTPTQAVYTETPTSDFSEVDASDVEQFDQINQASGFAHRGIVVYQFEDEPITIPERLKNAVTAVINIPRNWISNEANAWKRSYVTPTKREKIIGTFILSIRVPIATYMYFTTPELVLYPEYHSLLYISYMMTFLAVNTANVVFHSTSANRFVLDLVIPKNPYFSKGRFEMWFRQSKFDFLTNNIINAGMGFSNSFPQLLGNAVLAFLTKVPVDSQTNLTFEHNRSASIGYRFLQMFITLPIQVWEQKGTAPVIWDLGVYEFRYSTAAFLISQTLLFSANKLFPKQVLSLSMGTAEWLGFLERLAERGLGTMKKVTEPILHGCKILLKPKSKQRNEFENFGSE